MKTQYKKFHTEDQVDEWVTSYSDYFPSNDDNNKTFIEALNFYTGNANVPINRILRSNNKKMTDEGYEYFNKIYQCLSSNFISYHIPENIVVYRYISKSMLKHMCPCYPPKKGMILADNGFMSTTLLKDSIRDFLYSRPELNVLLEISVPKGTNGIYVGHLEFTLHEFEVILAPNTKLRIDNKSIFSKYLQCTVVDH